MRDSTQRSSLALECHAAHERASLDSNASLRVRRRTPAHSTKRPRTTGFLDVSPLDRPARHWYHRHPMSDATPARSALAPRVGRDGALDAALERLVPGRLPDRPDTPDLHVTAVRRLAAVTAQYAPFPEALDRRLRSALEIAWRQPALHASGRGDRTRARRSPRRRHDADGIGQDALLQRARSPFDPAGFVEPGAVSLSDQGARAGSARGAAGACARRWTRRRARRSACSPTTATRRRTRVARFARAPTSC